MPCSADSERPEVVLPAASKLSAFGPVADDAISVCSLADVVVVLVVRVPCCCGLARDNWGNVPPTVVGLAELDLLTDDVDDDFPSSAAYRLQGNYGKEYKWIRGELP